MDKEQIIESLWERAGHGTRREDIEAAYAAGEAAASDRSAKLAAWLHWCQDNCDDSTAVTEHMRALLAGKPAPIPGA